MVVRFDARTPNGQCRAVGDKMSDKYLHISISATNSTPERVWVQWTRNRDRRKIAEWLNALFHPEDRSEIKALLRQLVMEL